MNIAHLSNRERAKFYYGQGGGGAPFYDDLLTWHKPVSDNDFEESIASLPAKFLPRVVEYNGTSSYSAVADNGALDINQAATVFCFGGWVTTGSDITTNQYVFGKHINTGIIGRYGISVSAGIVRFVGQSSGGTYIISDNITLATNTRYYILTKIDLSNSKIYFYINNILQNAGGTSFIGTFSTLINAYEFYIGAANNAGGTGAELFFNGQLQNVRVYHKDVSGDIVDLMLGTVLGDEVLMVPNNDPSYAYDVSANAYHLESFNCVTDYALTGSLYPKTNGYSLWEHATSDPIQVPFDLTGSPISLTAGVNIPTGYTKTRDVVGSATKWNMADSLVNFDPNGAGGAAREIFDRSNVTRQTALSRASIYYDATSLATRSIYHITEIAEYAVMQTFFEAGYQDKASFGKVIYDGSDIISYNEHLNYATQKTGVPLTQVKTYCNIP